MSTPTRRRAFPFVVAALIGALVASSPAAAQALWSASATAPAVAVSGGILAKPNAPTCRSEKPFLAQAYIVLSWNAVPGATAYKVYLRQGTNPPVLFTTVTTGTSVEVQPGLLAGLGLLLSGSAFSATVTANTGAAPAYAWSSPTSDPTGFRPFGTLGLGGIECG